MARLVVRHHGQEIASLELVDGQEYLAGRAEDAQIVLPPQKGISRQHLKFAQNNGVWVVSLLARFGSLIHNGQTSEVLELHDDLVFSAPPFDFSFTLKQPEVQLQAAPARLSPLGSTEQDGAIEPTEVAPPDEQHSRLPAVRLPKPQTEASIELTHDIHQDDLGNEDATAQGNVRALQPYLRIISKSGKEEILRLEGKKWIAGRESACDIQLDAGRASRRHFELRRSKEGFFLIDLNSANGTLLNEEAIPANEPWELTSGDVIKVASTKLIFEVRDPNFASNLPVVAQGTPDHLPHSYGSLEGPAVMKVDPRAKNKKSPMVRYALYAVIAGAVYMGLSEDKPKPADPSSAENASTTPSFDQLTPEKKQAIKNSLGLAMNMYVQTRYELCIAELRKLHEMVPSYENSKELLTYCEHGAELLRKKEDADRRERLEAEAQQAIMAVVDECRKKVTPKSTIEEMQVCLAPAIERSPEHPGITDILTLVKVQTDQREAKVQMARAGKQLHARGIRQFEKAKNLYKSGSLAQAINEYEKFLKAGYGGLDDERVQAQRDVAQVRKELSSKVATSLQACREAKEKSQYKSAYQACEKALKEDASNAEAKTMKAQIVAELKRELKGVYEDSVLEESMGNIDVAKERWKQIMEKAIPGDEYHTKSKRNLQKYGGGD